MNLFMFNSHRQPLNGYYLVAFLYFNSFYILIKFFFLISHDTHFRFLQTNYLDFALLSHNINKVGS